MNEYAPPDHLSDRAKALWTSVVPSSVSTPSRLAMVLAGLESLVRPKPTAFGRATLKGSAGPACFLPTRCCWKTVSRSGNRRLAVHIGAAGPEESTRDRLL